MKYFKCLCLCSLITILSGPSSSYGTMIDEKDLHVGEELLKETLPLQNGARLYQLRGLRPHMWYEVKISYPAFCIGTSDLGLNLGRKLLNTEKIIFMTDGMLSSTDQGGISVLVNVKPEGVVAIPGIQEREYVMFNIGKSSKRF
ncbi:UNVERIFIED_CONTAM: hypothetical protein Slati_4379300 [Sesamum latifolium]|uniref:Uncharacterized protein n=1 Tax=Sesamum latifolium TaxID=2727402 RepID=A0AAW2SNM8_9LAMI